MYQFSSVQQQCDLSSEHRCSWKRSVVFNSAQVYPQSRDLNQIQFIIANLYSYYICKCNSTAKCHPYNRPSSNICGNKNVHLKSTVELHLPGLIRMASQLDMQKIQINDFSMKIGYTGSLKWKKLSTNRCFRLHIYLCTNKTLIHNSLYVQQLEGR